MRWKQIPEFRAPHDDGRSRRWPWVAGILAVFLFVLSSGAGFTGLAVISVVVTCPLPALQQNAGRGAGGTQVSPEQTQNAAAIIAEVKREGLPQQAAVVAVATAQAESGLRNLPNGDRDSVGLFQQRPSQGWGTPQQIQNPQYATQKFLQSLQGLGNWAGMSLEQAAQAVQKSANPSAYSNAAGMAQQLVGQLWGGTQSGQQSSQPSSGQPASGPGFACQFQTRPEPQGSPQPRQQPNPNLPFPIPPTMPQPGWKLQIPVPQFPSELPGTRVNPAAITPQCVAGALWAWGAAHLTDPAFGHPPALNVPSAYQMTAAAQAEGFRMDNLPTPGDMVVYKQGSFYGPNGHVGLVVGTSGNTYLVAEQNFINETSDLGAHWGTWDLRTISWPDSNVSGFIAAPPTG